MSRNDTPLLLLIWRRPHTLRQVIDAIRPVAPTRLFVACDGPRPAHPGEAEKVAATRALIEQAIDWPCRIERLYSDTNQGCRLGVSRAISWFFEQVEEGIILEDDCVPHPAFFDFCQELLSAYRDTHRVWQICGTNFINTFASGQGQSFLFSRYGPIWGWATWRRAWAHYDCNLSLWPEMRHLANDVYGDKHELRQKTDVGDRLFRGLIDTWDYQWAIIKAFNGGVNIIPAENLVQNIGFDKDATHTKYAPRRVPALNKSTRIRFPLSHYPLAVPSKDYDNAYAKLHFHPKGVVSRLVRRISSKLKS